MYSYRARRILETIVRTFPLVLSLLIEGTSQQCTSFSAASANNRNVDLYSAQQELAVILFNAVNDAGSNRNVLLSPYSVSRSLLVAYFLAGGQTERYLKKVLRLEEIEHKHELFAAYKIDGLLTKLSSSSGGYHLASKLYVSGEVPIRECVLELFPSELERISFRSSPEVARNAINLWTENATRRAIRDLFAVGTIDQNTDVVLVNAASLAGDLEHGFDRRLTRLEAFYINDSRRVQIHMMYLEGRFRHGISKTFRAHILEMPYKEDDLSLYVLLPPFSDTSAISFILQSLTTENLRKLFDGVDLTPKTVQVGFPKLRTQSTVQLTPIFESLVVGNFFESKADFRHLRQLAGDGMSVGQGIHKAAIDISEQSENTTTKLTDDKGVAKFVCNHPFVYVVYSKKTHGVMFMGIVRNPVL